MKKKLTYDDSTYEEKIALINHKVKEIIKERRRQLEVLNDALDSYLGPEESYNSPNIDYIDITKLSIDEINKMFFHYSHKHTKNSIGNEGLVSRIGRNSKGVDTEKSIYFSYGLEGLLETWDVWLKWRLNRLYDPFHRKENEELKKLIKNRMADPEEEKLYHYMRRNWDNEFINGEFYSDNNKINFLFEYQFQELQNSFYYSLDLVEGKDYTWDEVDVKKKAYMDRENELDGKKQRVMYGHYSRWDTDKVEKWNMNTVLGQNLVIEPDRIKQLTINGEKDDVLSIVIYFYDLYKENVPKDEQVEFDLLDNFIEYSKRKLNTEVEDMFIDDEKEENTKKK